MQVFIDPLRRAAGGRWREERLNHRKRGARYWGIIRRETAPDHDPQLRIKNTPVPISSAPIREWRADLLPEQRSAKENNKERICDFENRSGLMRPASGSPNR